MLSMMQNATTDTPTAAPAPRREGVQAIARAGAVLRALQDNPRGLALGDLADAVELPKSTVHRLVAALAGEELVSSAAGRVQLGGAIARLGAAGSRALQDELRPVLAQLRDELDETVDLAVLDGAVMRFVDQLPAAHRLRAVSSVGVSFPLHCTANGKALLATMARERVLALLPARLPRSTPATIVRRATLLTELEQVREQGVAFDREEHTVGISAVGAAVLSTAGAAAAISVPVPTARFRERDDHYARAVHKAAGAASHLLRQAQTVL
jgi:DNA-binding IclR family transcriptional regulator